MNPIAVGVDLCEVDRIREALARTPGLVERTWTDAEIAYCEEAADPAERFAARWAAKEAVLKCIGGGVGSMSLREIEVIRTASGAPEVGLAGAAQERADALGIERWLISLTHTADVAQAMVIAVGLGISESLAP